jgi:hypothetical protein
MFAPAPSGLRAMNVNERSRPGRTAGLALRLRTWFRARRLDRALARGEDPEASPELSVRAEQLTGQRTQLGDAVEATVLEAHSPPAAPGARVPTRRREIRENAESLLGLAKRLRDGQPIDVQGVAMALLLTRDGTSPLYSPRAQYTLGYAVRSALGALEPVSMPPDVHGRGRLVASTGWSQAA